MTYDPKLAAQNSPVGDTAAAYRLAHEMRTLEITQLANRNNFFMVFQGVLLAGLIQSQGGAPSIMNFCICLAGLVMALFQLQMAGGAKYWQIRWEVAVKKLELLLLEDLRGEKRVVQLFTSDLSHLTDKEKTRIASINTESSRATDPLNATSTFIDDLVREDLRLEGTSSWPEALWQKLRLPFRSAIASRYSVSKTPLYAAAFLLFLWTILWLHTFALWGKTVPGWIITLMPSAEMFRFVQFVK